MTDNQAGGFSIAAVERDTGLGKDTLRVWERRYGFPAPQRDAQGERCYPGEQVEKLRILKRLLDAGHRPGRVVLLGLDELHSLISVPGAPPQSASTPDPQVAADLALYLDLLQAHDLDALRRRLMQAHLRMGLSGFISDVLIPLNTLVGDAWMRGSIEIHQEHAFTELQQTVLRNALTGMADAGIGKPRVLLSTFPGEPHGLGLLMAEALFTIDGAKCFALGPQTPVWDIAQAAVSFKCDIVALGFSGCMNPNKVVEGLVELRRNLPAAFSIWVGGAAPVLFRRPVDGVTAVGELNAIHAQLLAWHRGDQ